MKICEVCDRDPYALVSGLGQVSYSYIDTPEAISVTELRAQNSGGTSNNIVMQTYYDGLGRAVKVILKSDPYREGESPVYTRFTDELNRLVEKRRLE